MNRLRACCLRTVDERSGYRASPEIATLPVLIVRHPLTLRACSRHNGRHASRGVDPAIAGTPTPALGVSLGFPAGGRVVSDIVRFSVSVEGDLLEQFDKYCKKEQFATRSEAVRQLIRDMLTRRAWESGAQEVAGTLTLVYDHHRPQLRDQLIQLQHDHTDMVVSAMHAHLTHDVCLEVIILRGPAGKLKQIASRLKGLKGIYKGELVMASADPDHA